MVDSGCSPGLIPLCEKKRPHPHFFRYDISLVSTARPTRDLRDGELSFAVGINVALEKTAPDFRALHFVFQGHVHFPLKPQKLNN